MTFRRSIDVIVPVLNEDAIVGKTIDRTLAALNEAPDLEYGIIIVDDGSTDRTWQIIQEVSAKDPRVRGVRLSCNFGHDAAVFTGLMHSDADASITMDCDGQHPFSLIPTMIATWRETESEVVNAVKSDRGKESGLYRLFVRAFGNFLSDVMKVDLQNATEFKLVGRSAREALLQCGDHYFFYRALVPWIGFQQVNLPFEVGEGMRAGRHWTFRSLVGFAVSGMVMFSDFPLRVMLYLGLAVMALCTVLFVMLISAYLFGEVADGYPTLLAIGLLNVGVVMTGLGVIGIYLRTTLNQTKGRPRAIVRETARLTTENRYL